MAGATVTSRQMAEIARRANVSPSTVSRVLSGKTKGVWSSAADRVRQIREIADELDYRPNFHARALKEGCTRTIGLPYTRHFPVVGNVYAPMLSALVEELTDHNYSLTWLAVDADDTRRSDLFLDGRLDGLIVHHELTAPLQVAVERAELPCVLVNAAGDGSLPRVLPDDCGGTAAITEHLLSLGHRRIAFLHAQYLYLQTLTPHVSETQRLSGYRQAMTDAGLAPLSIELPLGRKQDRDADLAAAADLVLGGADRPTAVIVGGADLAALLVKHLRRRGVDVPRQMSIAACHDTDAALMSDPEITAVHVPLLEIGRAAARVLIERIEQDGESTPTPAVVLPEQLIVRGSTVRPDTSTEVSQ